MSCPIHAVLAQAVRDLQKVDEFMDDMWVTYCHNRNDEPEWNNGHLSRDPARYSRCFLGKFLQHAAHHCHNSETYEEYLDRRSAKRRRLEPRYQELELRGVEVHRIWICVGQAELDEGRQSFGGNYHDVRVKLGSSSVVHSGTAVSMFVHCLDCGLFSLRLGCTLAPCVHLNCIHYEGKFDKYPRPEESPHVNRMDNVNNVFRAFGVDAGSTKRIYGKYKGRFLDPRLEHFVAVGTGKFGQRPCFDIAPEEFIEHVTRRKTKVLQDTMFVEQVSNKHGMANGINRWNLPISRDVVNEVVTYYEHNDPSTVVVHLDPGGTPLIVDDGLFDRDDIMQ